MLFVINTEFPSSWYPSRPARPDIFLYSDFGNQGFGLTQKRLNESNITVRIGKLTPAAKVGVEK